jgi:hypothetical protein
VRAPQLEDENAADGVGTHKIAVAGYGYHWYRIGSLKYILRREKV